MTSQYPLLCGSEAIPTAGPARAPTGLNLVTGVAETSLEAAVSPKPVTAVLVAGCHETVTQPGPALGTRAIGTVVGTATAVGLLVPVDLFVLAVLVEEAKGWVDAALVVAVVPGGEVAVVGTGATVPTGAAGDTMAPVASGVAAAPVFTLDCDGCEAGVVANLASAPTVRLGSRKPTASPTTRSPTATTVAASIARDRLSGSGASPIAHNHHCFTPVAQFFTNRPIVDVPIHHRDVPVTDLHVLPCILVLPSGALEPDQTSANRTGYTKQRCFR